RRHRGRRDGAAGARGVRHPVGPHEGAVADGQGDDPDLATPPIGGGMKALDTLKARLLEVDDLSGAAALLRWDQTPYMPPAGAAARGRQLATLSRLSHERFTDAETGRLLDAAARETASLPFESDEASLVRVTRRAWEQAVKLPSALVAELQEHSARSYQAWTE